MSKTPKVKRDALILLRMGVANVMDRVRSYDLKQPDPAHLLMMQALAAMEEA